MIRYVFIFTLLLVSPLAIAQPCEITTIASPQTITCGDCTTLSAFGYGAGNIAFEEDFNSGSPVGWQFTQAVTIANNTCGVPSPDGSNFMWMGDASVNPRSMETVPFDLTLGGVICFDMRYSEQGDASPCEGPDLSDEGVYLQYSIDNGATWVTIEYWDPNGGNDPQLTSWNQYCATIPAAAETGNTMIRWYQDDVSGAEYDHWGIDNVLITLNDPNFEISWIHDGYSYGLGQGGGDNPTAVCPTSTTTYEAIITDGVETCTSTISIVVEDPVIVVDAGEPASICPGECVDIDAEAKVIVSPAKEPTYCDNTIEFIAGTSAIPAVPPFFAGSPGTIDVELDINITDLNMSSVLAGSITEVCINGFTLFNGASLADLTVELICPDGGSIVLVPQNTTAGQSYFNTCFVPASAPITSGSGPYSGTFNPNQPFDNLVGCTANGTWTLSITGTHNELFPPTGTLSGWCISFDDPEISYEADFTWSPTTNMTGETTLNPTVCPNVETTYTLEATDANGCITVTDVVTISIDNDCCALTIDDVATTPAGCGASDGSATVTVSGDISGLQFSIDGGTTFQSSSTFSNLAAGNYTVQATDDNACDVFFNFTIDQDNAPEITDVTSTNPSCGATDGTITITASNGTLPYEYSIDGTNFDVNNSFNSLAAGTYTIIVSDANGCEDTQDISLINTDGPSVQSTNIVDANCGQDNGEITINLTGGTLPYSFSLDGAPSSTTNNFSNLAAGAYTITFEDASGCTGSETVTILDSDGITIESIAVTDASCGINDGEISIAISGGTAPHTFDLNNGSFSQTNGDFSNLAAGNYTILITDVTVVKPMKLHPLATQMVLKLTN